MYLKKLVPPLWSLSPPAAKSWRRACCTDDKLLFLMIYFIADAWSISRAQSNNTRAQQTSVTVHDKVGASTQSTPRGEKKNTFTAPQLFAHRHTRI